MSQKRSRAGERTQHNGGDSKRDRRDYSSSSHRSQAPHGREERRSRFSSERHRSDNRHNAHGDTRASSSIGSSSSSSSSSREMSSHTSFSGTFAQAQQPAVPRNWNPANPLNRPPEPPHPQYVQQHRGGGGGGGAGRRRWNNYNNANPRSSSGGGGSRSNVGNRGRSLLGGGDQGGTTDFSQCSPVPQELPNELLKTIFATKRVTTQDGVSTKLTANVHIEEGHLLMSLIKANGLKKCLEVGFAFGVSALFMCEALKTVSMQSPFQQQDSEAESSVSPTTAATQQPEGSAEPQAGSNKEATTSDVAGTEDTAAPTASEGAETPKVSSSSKTTASSSSSSSPGSDTLASKPGEPESATSADTQPGCVKISPGSEEVPAPPPPEYFLYSIDPNQSGKWKSIGLSNIRQAGFSEYHRCFEDKSFNTMPQLLPELTGKLDLVFIDGWHTFDYTLVDGFYADLLVRPGGFIVFDDALHKGPQQVVQYFRTNYPHWTQQWTYTFGGKQFKVPRTTALFQKSANDSRAWNFHVNF